MASVRRIRFPTSVVLTALLILAATSPLAGEEEQPVQIVVMDPLSLPLSCACVDGVGQRRYDYLLPELEKRLGRPVRLTFDESLKLAIQRIGRTPDAIIGPGSVVEYDAGRLGIDVSSLLSLSDRTGRTTVRGALLSRADEAGLTLDTIGGKRIAIAPLEHEECHEAVRRLLGEQTLQRTTITEYGSIEAAVFAVTDGEADVVAVTDFLPPLLVGCGKIAQGDLQPFAATEPVPFIQLFAPSDSPAEWSNLLAETFGRIRDEASLDAIESKRGFLATQTGWTDWRGEDRAGRYESLPHALPETLTARWTSDATGPAMAGIAATPDFVIVPDKDEDLTRDLFGCLDAHTGRELWRLAEPADDEIDYTNAPRATPVVDGEFVYLQGAGGELHCIEIATGKIVWQRHLLDDFDAEPLPWGCSVPPLLVDDRLIITPGAADAAVVALDRRTGAILWETPGHAAAYSALLVGDFGGRRQIVGYDAAGLAGWNIETGRRLWELIPPDASDFNVTTPVDVDGQLLLATENNGTRLYAFREDGLIDPTPIAVNDDCAPDTCTPVVEQGRIFCSAYGEIFCLDLGDGLKTLWSHRDDLFYDHTNLIAGNGRILAWTMGGELLLIDATADEFRIVSRHQPFAAEEDVETMSHPSLVGGDLYLRCRTKVGCFRLDQTSNHTLD